MKPWKPVSTKLLIYGQHYSDTATKMTIIYLNNTTTISSSNFHVISTFPKYAGSSVDQINRPEIQTLFYIKSLRHSQRCLNHSDTFFSYRFCGKGWSPLSSPLTRAGPEPSGRWPAAWCRARTGSYMCMASAWSQHVSNHTWRRSHRCRRWWHSSPLLHWRWQTCDLQVTEKQINTSPVTNNTQPQH